MFSVDQHNICYILDSTVGDEKSYHELSSIIQKENISVFSIKCSKFTPSLFLGLIDWVGIPKISLMYQQVPDIKGLEDLYTIVDSATIPRLNISFKNVNPEYLTYIGQIIKNKKINCCSGNFNPPIMDQDQLDRVQEIATQLNIKIDKGIRFNYVRKT